ncbi:helix-turn-helix transcriptional regulator [Advenella sp. WQ 585]|uniref:Helix-turn-helix transcriptional regulator n=1 Tax=Advenella mandrilli TaxID=2800330 RepID=A0ABS1EE70_9BURK|nr:metalloregulator ArsR/SmtB family transcription factor [Advenella mandrilli]MBK1780461.1 helix-turn-helix transcriptional regulator [Advenella mandrilli]
MNTIPTTDLSTAMRQGATEAIKLLKVMVNEDRLLMICHLFEGEKTVGEIEALLDIHQPNLSQHLTVLRKNGVVQTRKEGRNVYYSLADPKAIAMLEILHHLYCSDTTSS